MHPAILIAAQRRQTSSKPTSYPGFHLVKLDMTGVSNGIAEDLIKHGKPVPQNAIPRFWLVDFVINFQDPETNENVTIPNQAIISAFEEQTPIDIENHLVENIQDQTGLKNVKVTSVNVVREMQETEVNAILSQQA